MDISLETFKEVHGIMNRENAVLVYAGFFDQEIIKTMLKYTEEKLDSSGVDELVKRKIFNVMVEMLQNITKHQFSPEGIDTKSIFLLLEEDDDFQLITGNLCDVGVIDIITGRIDKVNDLLDDPAALKAHYKEARLASRISDVGGAGLGFIDMARKTGNELTYDFQEINSDDYKFFVFKTRINKIL